MKPTEFTGTQSPDPVKVQSNSPAGRVITILGMGLVLQTAACFPGPNPEGTYTHPACQSDDDPIENIPEDQYGKWQKLYFVGNDSLTCSDGEPYHFFVQYNEGATDLTVTLEPGGPCWDYESCNFAYGDKDNVAGQLFPENQFGETRNPHYMTELPAFAYNQLVSEGYDPVALDYHSTTNPNPRPMGSVLGHFGKTDHSQPTHLYNHVFLPNCTADAFTGVDETTYYQDDSNPSGPKITMHHNGRHVVQAVSNWIRGRFRNAHPGQLVVVGSSGGALGAQVNYSVIREGADPKCSTLVADSAPLFDEGGPQDEMKAVVAESWDLDYVAGLVDDDLAADASTYGVSNLPLVADDWGNLPEALPQAYPEDRFIYTAFQRDLIFSAFSFFPHLNTHVESDELLHVWQEEVKRFAQRFDGYANVSYFFPETRPDLCSHVVNILPLDKLYDLADQNSYSYSDLKWIGDLIEGGANPYEGGGFQATHNGTTSTYDLGDIILSTLETGAGTLSSSNTLPKLIAPDTQGANETGYSTEKLNTCFKYGSALSRSGSDTLSTR